MNNKYDWKNEKHLDLMEEDFWWHFDGQLWWLILVFLGSFILNGGIWIRIGIVIFVVYGFYRQNRVLDYLNYLDHKFDKIKSDKKK